MSTTILEELRKIMRAVDESPWVQHSITGETVKRICFSENAIRRIHALIAEPGNE